MRAFVCKICGYTHEKDTAPTECPICHVGSDMFDEQTREALIWADEHIVGVAQNEDDKITSGLRANFENGSTNVGIYLAMTRVAYREGYPEIGLYLEKVAYEEAEHTARFAELLGEIITNSTKKNLETMVLAENKSAADRIELSTLARRLGLDAIHDTVHEMAKDEARHGKAFEGLLKRYFSQ